MYLKKLKTIAFILAFIMLTTSGSKAAEECFEKTSRAIFKFNMAFDDIILEPIAKGYNKLPDSLKNGTSNLRQILVYYYQFQIIFFKEILNN